MHSRKRIKTLVDVLVQYCATSAGWIALHSSIRCIRRNLKVNMATDDVLCALTYIQLHEWCAVSMMARVPLCAKLRVLMFQIMKYHKFGSNGSPIQCQV